MQELYHHGIRGQRWGKKNGPPYPLDESDHSVAEKRAEKSGGGFNRPRKNVKKKPKPIRGSIRSEQLNTYEYNRTANKDARERVERITNGKENLLSKYFSKQEKYWEKRVDETISDLKKKGYSIDSVETDQKFQSKGRAAVQQVLVLMGRYDLAALIADQGKPTKRRTYFVG